MSNTLIHHPSSYRDPSGFIFESNGVIYRQINRSFREHFDRFIESGCYDHLVKKGFLIRHDNVPEKLAAAVDGYKIIQPERIPFISYPYEWSFDMLKDAALLTLQILREALAYDMALKDATPYNIQWCRGKLIFIDTLSFEKYEEKPWIAYRQFCETFLGPLLVMHYSKKQLPGLMLAWPEGIPLPEIVSLIPKRSRFSLYTYLHIHLHAKYSQQSKPSDELSKKLPKPKLLNLVSSLEILVGKLKAPQQKSTWSGYYNEAAKRNDYLDQKRTIISEWTKELKNVFLAADLGANEGEYTKLLASQKIDTIAVDFDPYCINELYLQTRNNRLEHIQPVVVDLATPSPAIGVNNEERSSFLQRGKFDLSLALALIHHLVIGKNIPFDLIAKMFSLITKRLIIEFIPKDDEKVVLMLKTKKDIYTDYTEAGFTHAFGKFFTVLSRKNIPGTGRVIFLMEKHEQ